MTPKACPPVLVWFKRDLRLHDHAALTAAVAEAREAGAPVLPLYVFEPGLWAEPDASARQHAFLIECLKDLAGELARRGAPLVVRTGAMTEVLAALRDAHGIHALHSHEETGNGWTYGRDMAVAAWCRAHGVAWREHRQSGVIRRLKSRDGWARRWDGAMSTPTLPAPSEIHGIDGIERGAAPGPTRLGLAPDPCPGRQAGGRAMALAQLGRFLTETGAPYRKAMSSPSAGAIHCSRLSPHLALGTLSMREVAQAAAARSDEARHDRKGDTRWRGAMVSFTGRLHWRDHFTQKLEDEPELEYRALHPAFRALEAEGGDELFAAWAEGQTGLPFLDACMRSLIATGWLNFRMRAMLVSVASHHFNLPWRKTGLHLARLFTDYEPGIHWPQVQMQSGLTGINTVRICNPVKQGLDHEADGTFIRQWVPELADVPAAALHTPWRWEGFAARSRGYPAPVADVEATARTARARMFGLRKGHAFERAADAVQAKHGSRRAGLPMIGKTGKTGRIGKSGRPKRAGPGQAAPDGAQGELFAAADRPAERPS
jgi:deoxyribodipyrimidine photo-lyase